MKSQRSKQVLQHFLCIGVFSLISLALQAQNAPVTTVTTVITAKPGEQVIVPLKVTGFVNIGGLTLAMDYDYAKLHFVSGNQNSLLGGTCNIGDIDLKNGFHRLTISWFKFGTPGITLPDGSSIVDYAFTYISGPTALIFFDMGPSCVFNDPSAKTLLDTPATNYYHSGLVSDSEIGPPIISAGGPTTICAGSSVTLTSSAGITYLWSTGETTASIKVTASGNYSVAITDGSGSSFTSTVTQVTVVALPNTPSADLIQPTCSVGTGTIKVNTDKTGLSFSIDGVNYSNTTGIFTGVLPGNYMLSAKNATGCVSTQSVTYTIKAQPIAPNVNITNPVAVVSPATVDLTADAVTVGTTSGLNFTYWTDEAATIPYPTPKQTISGTYYIKGSLPGTDCFDIKKVIALVLSDQPTDLSETESNDDKLSAFAIGNTEIQVNGIVSKNAVATLYDIQGKVVLVKNLVEGNVNVIRTQNIRTGIYILYIKDNEHKQRIKISVAN